LWSCQTDGCCGAHCITPKLNRDKGTLAGGVGPVTVAILMRNAMVAHKRQIAAGWL